MIGTDMFMFRIAGLDLADKVFSFQESTKQLKQVIDVNRARIATKIMPSPSKAIPTSFNAQGMRQLPSVVEEIVSATLPLERYHWLRCLLRSIPLPILGIPKVCC
jgi:hypothetical protein